MDEQTKTKSGGNLMQEADVGSGEKSPGQQDTDAVIEQISQPAPAPGPHPDAPPPKKP